MIEYFVVSSMAYIALMSWLNYAVLFTLPFIAAAIGWLTNFLAVKMLFHPREKKIILGFEVQGVFPKRQHVLAERLGEIVANELLSFSDIKGRLVSEDNLIAINQVIEEKFDEFLNERFPQSYPMLSMFVNDKIKNKFKKQGMEEIGEMIPVVIDGFITSTEKNVNIEQIVHDKVTAFSSDKLEQIVFAILSKEFQFIELVGAVLGFFIGLLQVLMQFGIMYWGGN